MFSVLVFTYEKATDVTERMQKFSQFSKTKFETLLPKRHICWRLSFKVTAVFYTQFSRALKMSTMCF